MLQKNGRNIHLAAFYFAKIFLNNDFYYCFITRILEVLTNVYIRVKEKEQKDKRGRK